jgi:hypothetical protein
MLPSSVTGGTWSPGATFDHVKKEKGAGFHEGGEIASIRNTVWQFMSQEIPPNY